jgi:hypothetical protein
MAKPAAIKPMSSVTDYIRLMVVAGSGWGKTPFAGTAERALFLSCDPEGVSSAFTHGSTADVWNIPSWAELEEAYRYFRDGTGCEDYDVVIIDSLNEAQNLNKDAILVAPNRSAKNDPDILSQQDYQRNQLALVKAVKQWNDLPIHIIWNVQWKKEEDETEVGFHYDPLIHGQYGTLAEQIKGYMKIIGYGTTVQGKRKGSDELIEVKRMVFTHQPPFLGRDRTNSLPAHIDNPTFPKIAALVAAKMSEARKAAASGGARGPRKAAPAPRKAAPVKRAGARKA